MFPAKTNVVYHPRHKSKASFAVSPFKEEDETNQRSLRCEEVVWYHSQTNLRFPLNMNYLVLTYIACNVATLEMHYISYLYGKHVRLKQIPFMEHQVNGFCF